MNIDDDMLNIFKNFDFKNDNYYKQNKIEVEYDSEEFVINEDSVEDYPIDYLYLKYN